MHTLHLLESARQYQAIPETTTPFQAKLEKAAHLLEINLAKFTQLAPQKKELFLDYKYTLIHFSLAQIKDILSAEQIAFIRSTARQCKQLLASIEPSQNQFTYSKYAQGLFELYMRSGNFSQVDASLLGSVLAVGPKPAGIEPGFMAVHLQDLVMYLLDIYQDNEEELIVYINKYEGDIRKIYELNKDNISEKIYKNNYRTAATKLPKYPDSTPVFLDDKDVQRTSGVKKAFKHGEMVGHVVTKVVKFLKNNTAFEVNKDAIAECLSTCIAQCFLEVGEQTPFVTEHTNGAIKIMNQATWLANVEDFGSKKAPASGGGDDTNNYRPRKLVKTRGQIQSITDNRILDLCSYLILMIFFGDRDKMGSKLQNMMIRAIAQDEITGKWLFELVGIDFGDGFPAENPVLDTLLPDGRFIQPKVPFKNFSALSDGSLKEKMKGVLLLAKFYGKAIDPAVIQSYSKEFQARWKQLPEGEGQKICDSFIHAFRMLQEEDRKLGKDNFDEYEAYIKDITVRKERMMRSMEKILAIFEPYIHCPAPVINLIDGLNQYGAILMKKAALCSKDGTHGLHYPRIQSNYKECCAVSKIKNTYTLTYKIPKEYVEQLWSTLDRENITEFFYRNNQINIRFFENKIPTLQVPLHQMPHYKDIAAGNKEIELQDAIEVPFFKKNHTEIKLELSPDNPEKYRLIFICSNKVIRSLIYDAFNLVNSKELYYEFATNVQAIDFVKNKIESIQKEHKQLTPRFIALDADLLNQIEFLYIRNKAGLASKSLREKDCFILGKLSKPVPAELEQRTEPSLLDPNCADESLFLFLYEKIHKKLLENPDVNINFSCYINSKSIYNKLKIFLTKYPEMLPWQVSLELVDFHSLEKITIHGKRELADCNYMNTISYMYTHCLSALNEAVYVTDQMDAVALKVLINREQSLEYLRNNFMELLNQEQTLCLQAKNAVFILHEILKKLPSSPESGLINEAKKHFQCISEQSFFWQQYIPDREQLTQEKMIMDTINYCDYALMKRQKNWYETMQSCMWISLHYTQLMKLIQESKLCKSNHNLQLLLASPYQYMLHVAVSTNEWSKQFAHVHADNPARKAADNIQQELQRILYILKLLPRDRGQYDFRVLWEGLPQKSYVWLDEQIEDAEDAYEIYLQNMLFEVEQWVATPLEMSDMESKQNNSKSSLFARKSVALKQHPLPEDLEAEWNFSELKDAPAINLSLFAPEKSQKLVQLQPACMFKAHKNDAMLKIIINKKILPAINDYLVEEARSIFKSTNHDGITRARFFEYIFRAPKLSLTCKAMAAYTFFHPDLAASTGSGLRAVIKKRCWAEISRLTIKEVAENSGYAPQELKHTLNCIMHMASKGQYDMMKELTDHDFLTFPSEIAKNYLGK